MCAYVEFEIEEGAYDISCPDATCDQEGVLTMKEISTLVSAEFMEKHHKFRLNRGLYFRKNSVIIKLFLYYSHGKIFRNSHPHFNIY